MAREIVTEEDGGRLGIACPLPPPGRNSGFPEVLFGGDGRKTLAVHVDREARNLGQAPCEEAGPHSAGSFRTVGPERVSDDDAPNLPVAGGLGDRGRHLGVVLPEDGADRDNQASGLVRDGQTDPFLAEIDSQDAH